MARYTLGSLHPLIFRLSLIAAQPLDTLDIYIEADTSTRVGRGQGELCRA